MSVCVCLWLIPFFQYRFNHPIQITIAHRRPRRQTQSPLKQILCHFTLQQLGRGISFSCFLNCLCNLRQSAESAERFAHFAPFCGYILSILLILSNILHIIPTKVTQTLFNRLLAAELLIPLYENEQVSSFLF